MTVAELIAILQTMPQELEVEINDNRAGQIHFIDQVDHFTVDEIDELDGDYPVVILQINC